MEKLEWYLVQFTPSKVLIKATWLLNALVFSFFLLSFLSLYTSKFGHWFLILSSSFWYVYYFQVMFSCILCMNNKLLEFLRNTIHIGCPTTAWSTAYILNNVNNKNSERSSLNCEVSDGMCCDQKSFCSWCCWSISWWMCHIYIAFVIDQVGSKFKTMM